MTETNRLFRQADIPERYKWKFVDDFRMAAPDGTPIDLATTVYLRIHQDLIEAAEEPKRGYLLHGNPGTGKTLMGCIALNELMLRWAKPGRFLSLSRTYFQKLRDTYSADSERYGHTWSILEELCTMPYLVLDDFGIQRGTEWEIEMLYDLVDARYGDQRFTVVTTNQPLDELKDLAEEPHLLAPSRKCATPSPWMALIIGCTSMSEINWERSDGRRPNQLRPVQISPRVPENGGWIGSDRNGRYKGALYGIARRWGAALSGGDRQGLADRRVQHAAGLLCAPSSPRIQ